MECPGHHRPAVRAPNSRRQSDILRSLKITTRNFNKNRASPGSFTMSSRPWARASAGAVRRWRRARSVAVLALGAFVLAGCGGGGGGGGGGNSGLSLSVSPLNVAVSATTAQPAPSASVQASVSGQQQSQQVYLAGK